MLSSSNDSFPSFFLKRIKAAKKFQIWGAVLWDGKENGDNNLGRIRDFGGKMAFDLNLENRCSLGSHSFKKELLSAYYELAAGIHC